MAISHQWTITDTAGNITVSSDVSVDVDLNTIALAQNSGGCGVFPVGFESVHVVTDDCGNSDQTISNLSRCYVFTGDGTVLLCNGEPFCFDENECGCGA